MAESTTEPWYGTFRISADEAWIVYANPRGQEVVRVLRDRCAACGSTDRVDSVIERQLIHAAAGLDTYDDAEVALCHACRLDHYGTDSDDDLAEYDVTKDWR